MKEIITLITHGAVGVFPTDTLYGIVAQALSKKSVERIYAIKGRDEHKPFIILISSITDLTKCGVTLSSSHKKFLKTVWPGSVSVIVPCPLKKFEYLHRGSKSLAFRLPEDPALRALIKKTGPLVAPSANPQGLEPAYTIKQAQEYFGPALDFYVDVGRKKGKPSTLVDLTGAEPKILRQGAVKISLHTQTKK